MKKINLLTIALALFFTYFTAKAQSETLITRINCGGATITTADGTQYLAENSVSDLSFSSTYTYNFDHVAPELEEPYHTFRYANRGVMTEMSYTFSSLSPDHDYRVILHFAEAYHGVVNTNWDTRVFDIDINNGEYVFDDYNIMTQAALPSTNPLDGAKKVAKINRVVNISDSNLVIRFTNQGNDAMINAIELFRIENNSVPVTAVSLNVASLNLSMGDTGDLNATVSPSNATDSSLTWSSSNTNVATVSNSGVVTAINEGSATITATSNSNTSLSANAMVNVTASAPPPTNTSVWSESNAIASYNGQVGIGVTTVQSNYKLAVNGKIRTKEIRVEQSNWPDYVFVDGYDLPTLKEIQEHIQEKGHLPNIPSAKEVETHGIELGEMNKLLLEKIEELTLLLIAQEQRIEKLEQNKK